VALQEIERHGCAVIEIAANAPLTLRATKELIRRLAAKRRLAPGDDADVVEMCYTSDDFREGVRAAVIDKDRNPKWSPPGIEDVTSEMVAPYFAAIGADELVFGKTK